jgi:integrase
MPLDPYTAQEVIVWRMETAYNAPSDYLWTTDDDRAGEKRGKQRVWLSTIMRYHIQPVATKLGITKRIGWHTFRHTFSTLLKANGEDVKVVQELLQHATARTTLDTYTQALGPDKRAAQSKVVEMIRPQGECVFSVYREDQTFSA